MLSEDELSILFGFARSYFHVDLERVADTAAFLKELLPKKHAGELFTVLGRAPLWNLSVISPDRPSLFTIVALIVERPCTQKPSGSGQTSSVRKNIETAS